MLVCEIGGTECGVSASGRHEAELCVLHGVYVFVGIDKLLSYFG